MSTIVYTRLGQLMLSVSFFLSVFVVLSTNSVHLYFKMNTCLSAKTNKTYSSKTFSYLHSFNTMKSFQRRTLSTIKKKYILKCHKIKKYLDFKLMSMNNREYFQIRKKCYYHQFYICHSILGTFLVHWHLQNEHLFIRNMTLLVLKCFLIYVLYN